MGCNCGKKKTVTQPKKINTRPQTRPVNQQSLRRVIRRKA